MGVQQVPCISKSRSNILVSPIHFQICTCNYSIVAFTFTLLWQRFGSFPPFVLHYHGASLPPGWSYVCVVSGGVIGVDGYLFQICGPYIIVNRECGTLVLQDRTSDIGGLIGGSIHWWRFVLFLDDGFNTFLLGFEFTEDALSNDFFASFGKAMKVVDWFFLCFSLCVRHQFQAVFICIDQVCTGNGSEARRAGPVWESYRLAKFGKKESKSKVSNGISGADLLFNGCEEKGVFLRWSE